MLCIAEIEKMLLSAVQPMYGAFCFVEGGAENGKAYRCSDGDDFYALFVWMPNAE